MHSLETEAQHIADATANQAYFFEVEPQQVAKAFNEVQSLPMDLPDISEKWTVVPAELCGGRRPTGKPRGCSGPLPVVLYIQGCGWLLSNAQANDRAKRNLAIGAGATVMLVEYVRGGS